MARPETESKTALGARLRAVRLALGDSDRADVAARLGIAKNSLAHYERGEREPSAETLSSYLEVYNVNIHWLLTGKGEMFGDASDSLHIAGGLLDKQRLEIAIDAVYEGLGNHRLPPKSMAEIILVAYDMLGQDINNRDNIIRLVRAA